MAVVTTYGMSLLRAMSSDVAPYFRSYLMALQPVETDKVPTAAVDNQGRVYWNRNFFAGMKIEEGAFVVLHEMMHLWLNHSTRAKKAGVVDFMVWSIATDCEINRTLSDMQGIICPASACLPRGFGLPDGLRAEEYYHLLMKQQANQPPPPSPSQGGDDSDEGDEGEESDDNNSGNSPGSTPGKQGDKNTQAKGKGAGQPKTGGPDVHGSGVGDKPGEWELPPGDDSAPGLSEVDKQIAQNASAQAISEASAKGQGNIPGGIKLEAEKMLAPAKIPWQRVLSAAVSRATNTTYGYDERTYRRVSPRSFSMGGDVLLPSSESYRPDVACVLDTSGSMSHRDINEGLSEIQGVCKHLDVAITVYTVDTVASEAQVITRAQDVKLSGGGGTDMSYGLAHAYKAAKVKPHVIIVLTDGYTDWPSNPPAVNVKVIIVVTSAGTDTKGCPSWATAIKIEK